MAQPFILGNTLRHHDQAIYDWLERLPIDYGIVEGKAFTAKSLLRVYSSPDKAFATMHDVLVRKNWIANSTDTDKFKSVPLPFCSIHRVDWGVAAERGSFPNKVIKENPETGARAVYPFPTPIFINYAIDFWARKNFTIAHISEWLLHQHGQPGWRADEFGIKIIYDDPWGELFIPAHVDGHTDNSDIEGVGDEDNRELRLSINLKLDGWLHHNQIGDDLKPIKELNRNWVFLKCNNFDFYNQNVTRSPRMVVAGNNAITDVNEMDFNFSSTLDAKLSYTPENVFKPALPSGKEIRPFTFLGESPSATFSTEKLLIQDQHVTSYGEIDFVEGDSVDLVTVDTKTKEVLSSRKIENKNLPKKEGQGKRIGQKFQGTLYAGNEDIGLGLRGEGKFIVKNWRAFTDYEGFSEGYTGAINYDSSTSTEEVLDIPVPVESSDYFLSAKVLARTGETSILLNNSAVDPTASDEIIVSATTGKFLGLRIRPKFGQVTPTIQLRIKSVGGSPSSINLTDISVRR